MIRILSALLLTASLDAGAAQVLQGKPDDNLAATVSRGEPTMIRMEGHRIRRVFGADGDFTVKSDKDAGTAYIQPTTDKPVFSAFVVDDTGRTWKLLLSLTDGLSDTIVIKGKGEPSVASAGGKDLARNQAIKRVVLALGADEETDMDTRAANEIVPLWSEAMFVLVKVVDGSFKGEKYQLTNISDKQMVIDDRELYRRGVVGISVEKPTLAPGEMTTVYVVSEGER